MKIRIKETPLEPEIDGIRLDRMAPGTIREVSPSVGAWLITQGYADTEMRNSSSTTPPDADSISETHRFTDRRRDDF